MMCDKCKTEMSIKNTEKWVTLLCKCGMLVIYPKHNTVFISKEEHEKRGKK